MTETPPTRSRRLRTWREGAAAATAIVVSVASLIVAIQTADSNEKMVAASTWPLLQIESSNTDQQNAFRISLAIANSGVGPAKLESLEVFWRGKAYPTSFALMTECCQWKPPTELPGTGAPVGVNTAPIDHVVIRAGESRTFLSVAPGDQLDAWHRFDRVRFGELTYRACYCSVFDECWISDLKSLHPEAVKSCPVPAVPYRE